MGESLLTTWMNARIRHILQISNYMKEDILHRHREAEPSNNILSPSTFITPFQEDYSFGWKDIIENAMDPEPWVADGYLFTGPDGCGKHTAAEMTYYNLEKVTNGAFDLVFLPAKSLLFTPSEQKAFEEERSRAMERGLTDAFTEDITHYFFECLFRQFSINRGICLLLDNSEQLEMKDVYDRLGKYMCISQCEYQKWSEDHSYTLALQNLFFIIIDKEGNDIPSFLQRKLLAIRMSYPNFSQRLTLLKNMGFEDEIAEPLAQKTENYTYACLRNLAKNAQIKLLSTEPPPGIDFYDDLVFSQRPLTTVADKSQQESFTLQPPVIYQENSRTTENSSRTPEENSRLTEEKIRLYQKIEQLIEHLPEILEKLGSSLSLAVPQTSTVSSKTVEEEPISLQQIKMTQEELESHRPTTESVADEAANTKMKDFLNTVLGENRMQRVKKEAAMSLS